MEFSDQVVVVTGGSSGIGRATALRFAQQGATVIIGDIEVESGEVAREEVRAGGGRCEFVPLDVTDDGKVLAFAEAAHGVSPKIDVLVNVVGWSTITPFLETTSSLRDKIVDINYLGLLRVTQAFLPSMVEAAAGKVVNVSSDAGRTGSSGESIYSGAKGGVIAFTKALAREMARHSINVNCVCPGPTDTPLLASTPDRHREALARATPFRRFAKPEEVADAVLFFGSPRSSFITGQVLSVSGGLTMVG